MAEAAIVKKIGAYEVERELGRGAFGVVYRAFHQDDPDTLVALKVVETRGSLDRVMSEPALLAKLDHPCVVRVLDYFPHGKDKLAIALEFVDGEDLKAVIDTTNQFPPTIVRELLVQIGGALAEVHAKGVVHRDLKPANILVDRSGLRPRYVLTDFGVGEEDTGIRLEKKVAGTYLFMAPEQLRGRPGPQSDLWALGVIAYRMLTGKYPFPGPTIADLARQIQLSTPPPPSAVSGQSIDATLEQAVLRLLDRSETERIGSAKELLTILGHKGNSKQVLTADPTRPDTRVVQRQQSLDETLSRGVRVSTIWAVIWAILFLVIRGSSPVAGLMLLAGFILFYRAHNRLAGWSKAGLILTTFGLAGGSWWVALVTDTGVPLYVITTIPKLAAKFVPLLAPAITSLLVLLWSVAPLLFVILACGAYARANRFRRERTLLRAAAAGVGSDEYLAMLRRELDYRYEDVGFHLKYAEALAARGDDRGAAIEARLLLTQDPYHFAGNLLLAQSYLRLGLVDDCEQVCEEYLTVAGYCFEFQELRDQARRQQGANA
jgi:serine/threonine-protein kinase